MLYIYDSDNKQYVKAWNSGIFNFICGCILFFAFALGVSVGHDHKSTNVHINTNRPITIDSNTYNISLNRDVKYTSTLNTFNKNKLANMINSLDIKYPHIVMAQSIVETGHFESTIFHKNNNLFGMKLPNNRLTTASGVNLGHAYYTNWQQSVYDYAIFQSRYLYKIDSENKYLNYLDENYAMKEDYDKIIERVVERYNLKKQFNKK
jgi:uncharacterized FlgJ-related protein